MNLNYRFRERVLPSWSSMDSGGLRLAAWGINLAPLCVTNDLHTFL